MSNLVSSELLLLSENLQLNGSSGRLVGMESLHSWLTSISHKITPILPKGHDDNNEVSGHIASPYDESVKVEVITGTQKDRSILKDSWYKSAESGSSASVFLDRWASAIERNADLVALVISTFLGTCYREVRDVEIGRAVAQLRYSSNRCPIKSESQVDPSMPEIDTAHLRIESHVDIPRLFYLIGMVFTHPKLQKRRLILSTSQNSPVAPLIHLLVQLAHIDRSGLMHVASVPLKKTESSWAPDTVSLDTALGLNNSTSSIWYSNETPGRSCTLITESADMFSAVEAAIAGARLWCWGRGEEAAHLILVQESIKPTVTSLLSERLSKCQLANSADHVSADVAPQFSHEAGKRLDAALAEARNDGVVIDEIHGVKLLHGEQLSGPVASRDASEGLDGPYIYVIPFRTAAEAIKLANHAPRCHRVSLWTEIPSQANEMTNKLKFREVLVNTSSAFDPRVAEKIDSGYWKWMSHRIVGDPAQGSETVSKGSSVLKSAQAAGGNRAAGWASMEVGERKKKLCGVAKQIMSMKPNISKDIENLFLSADVMVAAKQWQVSNKLFRGSVTVQESAKGEVKILIENSLSDQLLVFILRILLLGNSVSLVVKTELLSTLRDYHLDKLDAVKICEAKPGVFVREATGGDTVFYSLNDEMHRRVIYSCLKNAGGARLFNLDHLSTTRCELEDEIVRHFCSVPKVVWASAFDTFAN